MAEVFSIESRPTFRDIQGRFAKAEKVLLEDKRSMIRGLAGKFKQLAQAEAPEGKTKKFRQSIKYRTFQSGDTVGFKIEAAQPLSTFITEGTKAHRIQAKRARALVFFWPKIGMTVVVPKGGGFKTHARGGSLWVGKGYVSHPGTKPNPYLERAYGRWLPQAEIELARISTRYADTLAS